MMPRDPRRTPARPDLAAAHLAGQVDATRFVEGKSRRVRAALSPLRRRPEPDCPLDTQALHGEAVRVYEESEGWAWAQLLADGYVGWLPSADLGPYEPPPTHRVCALRTFLYPVAGMKQPARDDLSLGSTVAVAAADGDYVRTPDGFIYAAHLSPLESVAVDFVAVAEQFVGTPYLWGGKSSLGVDCSGLVQLAAGAAGIAVPRDSDMQAAEAGDALAIEGGLAGLRRGDLVFWKGHVAIVIDPVRIVHANAHHMMTVVEPLAEAVARISSKGYGLPTGFRRLGAGAESKIRSG